MQYGVERILTIQLNNISQNDGKVVISKDKRKSYLNLQRIKERAE